MSEYSIELPNPYEIVLKNSHGNTVEIPWDFARHYCDHSRMEALAARCRQSVGDAIRQLRRIAGVTQEELATGAGIGRVTLLRIEKGEQSPRYETLAAFSQALRHPISELLAGTGPILR